MTGAANRSAILLWLLPALLAIGAAGGHRLPNAPPRVDEIPAAGFELHMFDQLQRLAEHVTKRAVRVEALHRPEPPFDGSILRMEDGVGVVVAPGRLLTTARYLEGAERVQLVRRDAKVLPTSVVRLDPDAGLALLAFEPADLPETAVLRGFSPIPPSSESAAASEVVIPLHLVGRSVSVVIGAVLEDTEAVFLSGQLANGVPAFDNHGRLVALADRPTPDRTRSVAHSALRAEAWLEEKTAPTEVIPRGPGP